MLSYASKGPYHIAMLSNNSRVQLETYISDENKKQMLKINDLLPFF